MPARYFLRTREQYENAPLGTRVRAFAFDDEIEKITWVGWQMNGKWIHLMPNLRSEVIRWGSGIVLTEVSRTLTKVDQ